jgi:hypothetical protein
MTIIERARRYVAVMPAATSGAGGHNATFAVACALVKGFDLSVDLARPLLAEYNGRCQPPWSERELEHKLRQAETTADTEARGYLIGQGKHEVGAIADDRGSDRRANRVWSERPKPVYDPERLREFAGPWAQEVDLVWLANRSSHDPASISSGLFLELLYRSDERVLCFTEVNKDGNPWTQGEAVWPREEPPARGKCGVWYLAQPVDGEYHLNPRTGKTSRRSEEAVSRWPFLVLESDEAPLREWLGALARLPLRITAIYTSGGRSVHALVRIDALTKGHWDDLVKRQMEVGLRFLVMNGADKGVFSAVRLTRLPGAWREGKMKEGRYVRFERPQCQKLLYLNTDPAARPLCELPPRRDVEQEWCDLAVRERADADDSGGEWIAEGLGYYARVSARCRDALRVFTKGPN